MPPLKPSCYLTMILRIEAISEVDVAADENSAITINADELEQAAKQAVITDPTSESSSLVTAEYCRWANALHARFNWATRKDTRTGEYLTLSRLLTESHNFWRSCHQSGMTYPEADFFIFIGDYVK